jgi:archaellum component FlaG (FlaF/FlaG flagellin family)
MSVLIPGVLVIASFLLASLIMFGTFLTTSAIQAQSLKELGKISQERIGSAISITSGSVTSSVTGSHTNMSLLVENTGSQSVVDFAQMDVIVQYTDAADNPVLSYLDYNPAGVGDNQWTNPVTGVTPDTFNSGI